MGVVNYIDDGFSWTILRCSHDDQKVCSVQKVALKAECNSKLAIGLNLMEECFLPMVDPRTGINMIPHVLYNLGSVCLYLVVGFYFKFLLKDYQVLFSRVLTTGPTWIEPWRHISNTRLVLCLILK